MNDEYRYHLFERRPFVDL